MANDLIAFRNWLDNNSGNVEQLLHAASEVIQKLAPTAAEQNTTIKDLVNDDPVTVRALLDAVNIGTVAGNHGVTVDDVMGTIGALLGVVKLVTAFV